MSWRKQICICVLKIKGNQSKIRSDSLPVNTRTAYINLNNKNISLPASRMSSLNLHRTEID